MFLDGVGSHEEGMPCVCAALRDEGVILDGAASSKEEGEPSAPERPSDAVLCIANEACSDHAPLCALPTICAAQDGLKRRRIHFVPCRMD